ncbi:hypothetical protein ASD65_15610 [Microbacterium sp. Root61]|uniref:HNH endonuclease n=1 Tax=Microbacterium sp. Root61 TaxID=1736570 RepID=UPI0006FEBE28|nr:HNH endonuclease signature motif containing protein [Microbacterium sp. Root61]KRA25689.1 hypothetical protein ASD65_15610 [Microbacterium sp. Root61]
MRNPLDEIHDIVEDVRAAWPAGDSPRREDLARLNDALGRARRVIDSAQSRIAAEIARESRPELGRDSLAKELGYRSPTAMLAATLGTTNGEAARLVQVGEATAPRQMFSGEQAPARHPHVADALAGGAIGAATASAIITMLDRVALRAGPDAVYRAEQTLVAQAPGLSIDQLARIITRAEAWLDPDGVAPREDELRSERSLHIREERSGMLVFTLRVDPEHGAPVKTAIEAIVTAELRAAHDDPDAAQSMDAVRRTIPQMQADALTLIAEHVLGCTHRDVPVQGATVVVRITLQDLVDGTGHATIDGVAAPVSAATARRMAAGGGVIPCVLGGDSEVLDFGRTRRLFSAAQRLALVERDGGCAMCGAPPGHTKVHHIRWWARDAGPTDLANGILLCESCHHRIHDNGWEIRIDGPGVTAPVWFIPPTHVDFDRTPRRGARGRYDYAA